MLNNTENINNLDNKELFDLIFKIINLHSLSSENEAKNLIYMLTNHPSPLREAVAYKVSELIPKYPKYFQNSLTREKILDAICDINPNTSRIICSTIKNNEFIANSITEGIINKLFFLIEKVEEYKINNKDFFENKIKNKKNHAKNKILFSIYWYLEALSYCNFENFYHQVLKIINFTINFYDYTVREKTVKLLSMIKNPPDELLQKAINDQNFYVKIQVYDKMNFEDLN